MNDESQNFVIHFPVTCKSVGRGNPLKPFSLFGRFLAKAVQDTETGQSQTKHVPTLRRHWAEGCRLPAGTVLAPWHTQPPPIHSEKDARFWMSAVAQCCRSRPFEQGQGSHVWVKKKKPLKPQCRTAAIGQLDFGFNWDIWKMHFQTVLRRQAPECFYRHQNCFDRVRPYVFPLSHVLGDNPNAESLEEQFTTKIMQKAAQCCCHGRFLFWTWKLWLASSPILIFIIASIAYMWEPFH